MDEKKEDSELRKDEKKYLFVRKKKSNKWLHIQNFRNAAKKSARRFARVVKTCDTISAPAMHAGYTHNSPRSQDSEKISSTEAVSETVEDRAVVTPTSTESLLRVSPTAKGNMIDLPEAGCSEWVEIPVLTAESSEPLQEYSLLAERGTTEALKPGCSKWLDSREPLKIPRRRLFFENIPTRDTDNLTNVQNSRSSSPHVETAELLLSDETSMSIESLPPLEIERYRPAGWDSNIGKLDGRRIVDIQHYTTEVRKLENHECNAKNKGFFSFMFEKRVGLNSQMVFMCNSCKEKRLIETNPQPEGQPGINESCVWGTVSSGNGFNHMEQMHSTMDIPPMNQKYFIKCHNAIGKDWLAALANSIEEAARDEYDHAKEIGQMDGDVGLCTVIVDGGWSHRSYGHSYTAKSGVAVIIGQYTKKILYIGVRNKYCSTCAIAARREVDVKDHQCFRNWSGSSPAMEADIVVSGFLLSEDSFKLRYNKFIGDGDSSVHKRILDQVPYSRCVKKIECANHLVKNVKKHLYNFAKEKIANKRLISNPVINAIGKYCRKMIIIHSKKEHPVEDLLKNDLNQTLPHIFGNHRVCRTDICTKAGFIQPDNKYDNMTGVTKARLSSIIGVLSAKSSSLIYNCNSNAAEQYMHVLSKFTGGKQVFYGRRNSFNVRCYGAGLSFQYGPNWSRTAWKSSYNVSPGKSLKKMILRRTLSNERRRKYNIRCRSAVPTMPCKERSINIDYGKNCQKPDLPDEEIYSLICKQIDILSVDEQQRNEIEERTRGQSDNSEWFDERSYRLTSSTFGQICKRRLPAGPLVQNIMYNRNSYDGPSVRWGRANEKVAIEEYMKITKRNVRQCGLYVCMAPKCGYLAASPDGIIDEELIVEVKCPYNIRDLHPLEGAKRNKNFFCGYNGDILNLKRNHNYYYQIQGQLYISGRTKCHFVVWTPKGLSIEEIELDISFVAEMLPKLERFYFNEFGPELVDSRKERMLPIRHMPDK